MVWRSLFAMFWVLCLSVQGWAQSAPCTPTSAAPETCAQAQNALRGWGFAEAASPPAPAPHGPTPLPTPLQLNDSGARPVPYISLLAPMAAAINRPWLLGLLVCSFAMLIVVFWRRRKRNYRRARRHYCQTHVALQNGDATHLTTIVDISRVGARLVVQPGLAPHDLVALRFDRFAIDGRILRVTSHFAMVNFYRTLSRLELKQALRQPACGPTHFAMKKGSAQPGAAFSKHG